jgi:DNA-binding transcriptional MerR regulator
MPDTTTVLLDDLDSDTMDVVWVEPKADAPAAGEAEYSIGELAIKFGMTHRALRFYESREMIAPRRIGRTRIYGQTDCDRLAVIVKGKKLGFTLAEIAQMIDIQEGRASAATLRLTHEACAAQIKFFEEQMAFIAEGLEELRRIQNSLGAGRLHAGRRNPAPSLHPAKDT